MPTYQLNSISSGWGLSPTIEDFETLIRDLKVLKHNVHDEYVVEKEEKKMSTKKVISLFNLFLNEIGVHNRGKINKADWALSLTVWYSNEIEKGFDLPVIDIKRWSSYREGMKTLTKKPPLIDIQGGLTPKMVETGQVSLYEYINFVYFIRESRIRNQVSYRRELMYGFTDAINSNDTHLITRIKGKDDTSPYYKFLNYIQSKQEVMYHNKSNMVFMLVRRYGSIDFSLVTPKSVSKYINLYYDGKFPSFKGSLKYLSVYGRKVKIIADKEILDNSDRVLPRLQLFIEKEKEVRVSNNNFQKTGNLRYIQKYGNNQKGTHLFAGLFFTQLNDTEKKVLSVDKVVNVNGKDRDMYVWDDFYTSRRIEKSNGVLNTDIIYSKDRWINKKESLKVKRMLADGTVCDDNILDYIPVFFLSSFLDDNSNQFRYKLVIDDIELTERYIRSDFDTNLLRNESDVGKFSLIQINNHFLDSHVTIPNNSVFGLTVFVRADILTNIKEVSDTDTLILDLKHKAKLSLANTKSTNANKSTWLDPEEDNYGVNGTMIWRYDANILNVHTIDYTGMDPIKKRLFGIELEYAIHDSDSYEHIYREHKELTSSHFLFKHDGSIDSSYRRGGLEVVSVPMSKDNLVKKLDNLIDKLGDSVYTNSSCGTHIHVSRQSCSERSIVDLKNFIANPDNRGFIDVIAGRPENRYCKRYNFENVFVDRLVSPETGMEIKVPSDYEKYRAINALKPQTVEFRLFAATQSLSTIEGYLDFCDSILDYLDSRYNTNKPTKGQLLDYKKYIEFLTSPVNKEKWTSLKQLLVTKGYINKKKKPHEKE